MRRVSPCFVFRFMEHLFSCFKIMKTSGRHSGGRVAHPTQKWIPCSNVSETCVAPVSGSGGVRQHSVPSRACVKAACTRQHACVPTEAAPPQGAASAPAPASRVGARRPPGTSLQVAWCLRVSRRGSDSAPTPPGGRGGAVTDGLVSGFLRVGGQLCEHGRGRGGRSPAPGG